jgi:hypothetical protein
MTAEQIAARGPAFALFARSCAGCFPRGETRGHLATYARGLMSDLPRKNVEPSALAYAPHQTPDAADRTVASQSRPRASLAGWRAHRSYVLAHRRSQCHHRRGQVFPLQCPAAHRPANAAERGFHPRQRGACLPRRQERDRILPLRGPKLRRTDAALDPLPVGHDLRRPADRAVAGEKTRRSRSNRSPGRSTPFAADGSIAGLRSRRLNVPPRSSNTTTPETGPPKNHDSKSHDTQRCSGNGGKPQDPHRVHREKAIGAVRSARDEGSGNTPLCSFG